MPQTWRWTLIPILIALALFAHAIPGAGFVADDAFNLSEHARHGDIAGEWFTPTYAHAGGARGHIWRPIPASIQHTAAIVFGRTGEVFRSINLVVHLLNVWLIMLAARRWGAHHKVAAMAAMLWTVHSSMPDAVCWSSDIYDLMATTAMLTGISLVGQASSSRKWPLLAFTVLLACLCKESSLALVPTLAILAAYRHGRKDGIWTGIATALGGGIYWLWHRLVTSQGYLDALSESTLAAIVDAWIMSFGWILSPPSRAYMAHIFDRSLDTQELWMGVAALVLLFVCAADLHRRYGRRAHMGAAVLCTGILLIPAAIGIPFIGVAPLRYIYMPMALFLPVSAATWPDAPRKRGSFMVFLFCALCAPTTAMRVSDFDNDLSLWSAELSAEPQNPYAAGSLARALIANNQADEGIAMWSEAIEKAPSGIRVFDRANEQWLLAQTAFMKGHPGTGLKQVTNLIDEAHQAGTTPPVMAHCLKADSLDALGRNDEASVAAKLCR